MDPPGSLPGHRAKLRTKTGCLTCRSRRKKCDERAPICGRCSLSKRACHWPTEEDLYDSRHRKSASSHNVSTPSSSVSASSDLVKHGSAARRSPIPIYSDSIDHRQTRSDFNRLFCHYFMTEYFPIIVLPDARDRTTVKLAPMLDLEKMTEYSTPLKNAIAACSASHLYFTKDDGNMRQVALTGHSRAISGVLKQMSSGRASYFDDTFLGTLIFLLLNGVHGMTTPLEATQHLAAAVHVVKHRFVKYQQMGVQPNPLDCILAEALLIHGFYFEVRGYIDEFQSDLEFWLLAESFDFQRSILGVPKSLYRFIIEIIRYFRWPALRSDKKLHHLESQLSVWEGCLVLDFEDNDDYEPTYADDLQAMYKDVHNLYILAASMLLDQAKSIPVLDQNKKMSTQFRPGECWQLRAAIRVIKRVRHNKKWVESYLGGWVVNAFGYALSTPEDITVIRDDLRTRLSDWNLGYYRYYIAELEGVWARRLAALDGSPDKTERTQETAVARKLQAPIPTQSQIPYNWENISVISPRVPYFSYGSPPKSTGFGEVEQAETQE